MSRPQFPSHSPDPRFSSPSQPSPHPRTYFPLLPGGSLFNSLRLSEQSGFFNNDFSELDLSDYQIDPLELGFIPPCRWKSGETSLSNVIQEFFKARPSRILRFEQKLWNALALTRHNPMLYSQIGVKWVSMNLIKVNRDVFGKFINVSKPAAALYNNQGSFTTHGFVEVPLRDVNDVDKEDLNDVDESITRLFRHRTDSFRMKSDQTEVMTCRYTRIWSD
jgi:hypothetical protein